MRFFGRNALVSGTLLFANANLENPPLTVILQDQALRGGPDDRWRNSPCSWTPDPFRIGLWEPPTKLEFSCQMLPDVKGQKTLPTPSIGFYRNVEK